jgi:hypothetical protein
MAPGLRAATQARTPFRIAAAADAPMPNVRHSNF